MDSFKEVRVDTRPAAGRARLGRAGGGGPRRRRGARCACATAGPQNANPEFRVYRTEGGPVRIVRRFRGDGTTQRRVGRLGDQRRPGGGRQLCLPGARARRGRQRDAGAAAGAHARARPRRARAPRCGGSRSRARWGWWMRAPSRAWTWAPRRAATGSPSRVWAPAATSAATAAAGRRAARAHTQPMPAPGSTWCACGPAGRRAVWPLAVAGSPPAARGQPGAPAGGAAHGHLAGPQRLGLRPRRLRRHARTARARSPTSGRSRRAACRRGSRRRSPRCCASSIASGWRTTSPPTCRWRGGRGRRWATRRAWRWRAPRSGCRAPCATACARRSRRTA